MKETVVLAYSGGLDTSFSVKWIQEKYDVDVVTMTVDVGQGDDLRAIEEKAAALGALKHHTIDVKMDFVKEFVFPSIKANGLYEGEYPISTALARPLIASKLVETAEKENATGVAHGCTGKGNDQVRFDVVIKSLAPHLKIIAPIREFNLTRTQELEYLQKNSITLPFEVNKTYSIDQNIWGRSIEGSDLENPMKEPKEEAFEWTVAPEKAPDMAEYLTIGFEKGLPVSLDGDLESPVKVVEKLNTKVGKHGVGRIDHIEDRLVGIKSREVYECPAAITILQAHRDLEKAILTRHEIFFKQSVDAQWAFLVYSGLWYEPLKKALDAFIDCTQQRVTGTVKLKLYKGGLRVVGRSSPNSLYDFNLATYGVETTFDQNLAKGFIELWGLPTTVANLVKRRMEHDQAFP